MVRSRYRRCVLVPVALTAALAGIVFFVGEIYRMDRRK